VPSGPALQLRGFPKFGSKGCRSEGQTVPRGGGDEVNKVCALRPVDPLAGILATDVAVAVVGKQHRVAEKARGAMGVDVERGCRPQESWR
jgi:hypothetical protein